MMRFRHGKYLLLAIVFWLLIGCSSQRSDNTLSSSPDGKPVLVQDLDITTGQTIYAPAYSKIYYTSEGRTLALMVTLNIHNTDAEHPIIITSIKYYDAQGQLVEEYLPQPRRLEPMATADFLVYEHDQSAGLGANFLVEWVAEQPVYEPIVETVMLNAEGTQGISFISPGRVIDQLN